MSDGKTKGGTTASRAGALQSSVNILLHTHYAIRLWEGRKRDSPDETGVKKKRPEIISMPQAIARAGNASRDSAADNPYADMALVRPYNEQHLKLMKTSVHWMPYCQPYPKG